MNHIKIFIIIVLIIGIIGIVFNVYIKSDIFFYSLDQAFDYGEKEYSNNFYKYNYYKDDEDNYIVIYKNKDNLEFYISKIIKKGKKYKYIRESPLFTMNKDDFPYSKFEIPVILNKKTIYVNMMILYDDNYYIINTLNKKNYYELNQLYIFYNDTIKSYKIKG